MPDLSASAALTPIFPRKVIVIRVREEAHVGTRVKKMALHTIARIIASYCYAMLGEIDMPQITIFSKWRVTELPFAGYDWAITYR